MQKIQDFLSNNKVAVVAVAIAAAVGIGVKVLSNEGRGSVKILDASIQSVPLIDRLGGEDPLKAISNRLFGLITGDKELKQFFAQTDKGKLQQHFVAAVAYLFGGKAPAKAYDLGQSHANLKITENQFAIVMKHLEKALNDLGVDNREIEDAKSAFLSIKNQFVTIKSA